jgi:glycosyltransferase involved in cell wall biosynthesis
MLLVPPDPEEPMPRPHLLYLAWGFPPSRAGGVYRALATVNAFAAAGWRVTVITVEREVFEQYTGVDTSLEDRVAPDVRVVRIPFAWPARSPDIRTYSALRVAAAPVWSRIRRVLDKAPFPEASYGPWRRPLTDAARQVHAEDPVDLVVATANPHVTFAAAFDLHAKSGVPYVMDYRDAWRLDVFSGREMAAPSSREGRWERRLLESAHEAWLVNEPIRDWYADAYPDLVERLRVVANGWDPELLEVSPPVMPRPDGPLRFAYLGTISSKVPVEELVEGWGDALRDGRLPAGSTLTVGGHLGHFSVPHPGVAEMISHRSDSGVRFVGPVPKADVGRFYSEADVLVLALGAGRYVTSGKVYEYIATGRPILALHDPANAATEVLAEHPMVARVSEVSRQQAADAIVRAAEIATTATQTDVANTIELANRYRRDEQLAPVVNELTGMVTR